MLSRNRISFIRSLQQKKFREENRLFVAEGEKLVLEFLESDFKVESVYGVKDWIIRHDEQCRSCADVQIVSEDELAKISGFVTPQFVLALIHVPEISIAPATCLDDYTLLLDGIRDPGNMGTIIRTADWFGIQRIIASNDCADHWNPKVVQATMGSMKRVKIFNDDLVSFVNRVREAASTVEKKMPSVYGAFLEGNSLYEAGFSNSGIIVIGNESNGIRKETSAIIDQKITIPRYSSSGAESLNAAVATALFLSEVRRLK